MVYDEEQSEKGIIYRGFQEPKNKINMYKILIKYKTKLTV